MEKMRGSSLSWEKGVECLACPSVANHLSTITGLPEQDFCLNLLLRWGAFLLVKSYAKRLGLSLKVRRPSWRK